MKWISNEYTKQLVENNKHLIPEDFDPMIYTSMHPDLIQCEVNTSQKATEHYLMFGIGEGRNYKQIMIENLDTINIKVPEFWNNGKNLLYFSPMAPDFDCSSGGNRLLQILKILKLDFEYNVWFLCNGYNNRKYIEIVKELNIPVFVPNIHKGIYLNKYLQEAADNKIIFDNAIFSWYDIGNQYIDIVKSLFPSIKILVDSVDVHWVREQRGKNSGQLLMTQNNIEDRKNIEKNVYSKANTIFAITEDDKKHIQKELGYGYNIKILSNIHDSKNIKLGKHIIFIGNYNHGPNVEAVKKTINIYTKFQKTKTYHSLKNKPCLLIAGPYLDESIQQKIQNIPEIQYLGQVDNLNDLYKKSCLMIAPLFWGAGIKGKICDAGMCGVPILTSDIGNEGIKFAHRQNALITNSEEGFIEELEYFFSLSLKEKVNLGRSAQKHLSQIVSRTSATNILKHSLQDKHIIISIVTYNQPEKLEKCLETILEKTKYSNYNIVITDNGIQDQSEYIKNKFNTDKIIYIKNNTNEYFIIPNNKIINDTKYQSSDILLINDDIEILDNYWLNYLYSSAYSADYIAAAGGKTLYPNGKLAEAGAELYSDGTGRNKGRHQDADDPQFNIPHYTGYCSGCLLYMRRDAIDKLGPLSEQLDKMYYEDSEWQYRAHINGLKTIYEPRCVAIHDEGSSSGTDITKGMKKYQEINRVQFLKLMRDKTNLKIETFNE
jgi:GT2 family glycosyltransferase